MTAVLTKEQMLAFTTPAKELVTVEGFGSVWVRGLTASEKNDLDGQQVKMDVVNGKPTPRIDNQRMTAKWLRYGCINEDGTPMYEPGEIAAIGKLPAAFTSPIEDAIKRLSGGDRGVSLEDLSRKNSGSETADET